MNVNVELGIYYDRDVCHAKASAFMSELLILKFCGTGSRCVPPYYALNHKNDYRTTRTAKKIVAKNGQGYPGINRDYRPNKGNFTFSIVFIAGGF